MITAQHPEWPSTKAALVTEIEQLRTALEAIHLTPEQSAVIRGEIAALRKFIGRIEPSAVAVAEPSYT
jgi:hypothetical protein